MFSHKLFHHPAVFEEDQGGNALNPKVGGQLLSFIHIDFGHQGAAGDRPRNFFQFRPLNLAGAAPWLLEIHEHDLPPESGGKGFSSHRHD